MLSINLLLRSFLCCFVVVVVVSVRPSSSTAVRSVVVVLCPVLRPYALYVPSPSFSPLRPSRPSRPSRLSIIECRRSPPADPRPHAFVQKNIRNELTARWDDCSQTQCKTCCTNHGLTASMLYSRFTLAQELWPQCR